MYSLKCSYKLAKLLSLYLSPTASVIQRLFMISYWLWYHKNGNGAGNTIVPSTGIEAFYKVIQQIVTQKLSTKTTKKFLFK